MVCMEDWLRRLGRLYTLSWSFYTNYRSLLRRARDSGRDLSFQPVTGVNFLPSSDQTEWLLVPASRWYSRVARVRSFHTWQGVPYWSGMVPFHFISSGTSHRGRVPRSVLSKGFKAHGVPTIETVNPRHTAGECWKAEELTDSILHHPQCLRRNCLSASSHVGAGWLHYFIGDDSAGVRFRPWMRLTASSSTSQVCPAGHRRRWHVRAMWINTPTLWQTMAAHCSLTDGGV